MLHHRSHHVISLLFSLAITSVVDKVLAISEPDCSQFRNESWRNPKYANYCRGTRSGHRFWASSLSPIAANLSPDAKEEVTYFMEHMENIGTMAKRKRAADFLLPFCRFPKPDSIPDNQQLWLHSSDVYVNKSGVPKIKSHCFTSVSSSTSNASNIIPHIRNLNRLVNDSGRQLANRARTIPKKSYVDRLIRSWKTVVGSFQGIVEDSVYMCSIWNVVGFRTNGKWGIVLKLTNDNLNENLQMGRRMYISEIVTTAPGKGVYTVKVKAYKERISGAPVLNTTTILNRWAGRAENTQFFRMPVDQTPAVSRLLELSKKDRDLVQDTVFGSNIAILVLPIFMTLVPISTIDYVETSVVLFYALMTDIVSTLPLFVKAIELLTFREQSGCESWVHGIEAKEQNSAVVIETWCASCKPKNSFRVYGYVFLSCSIFFMIVGVGAEIYARQKLLNSLKKTDALPRRFWSWAEKKSGYPSMHWYPPSTASSTACPECTCVHEPNFSISDDISER